MSAADELFTSPSFQKAMIEAAKGNTKVADNMLEKLGPWKKLKQTLPIQDLKTLQKVGAVAWLTDEEEPDNSAQQEEIRAGLNQLRAGAQ